MFSQAVEGDDHQRTEDSPFRSRDIGQDQGKADKKSLDRSLQMRIEDAQIQEADEERKEYVPFQKETVEVKLPGSVPCRDREDDLGYQGEDKETDSVSFPRGGIVEAL